MPVAAIHVIPDDSFDDDWVVRDERGHELGHYPTRESAESDGRVSRKSFM